MSKTKGGLNNHMLYHYGPKFSCSFCDHKSYTKSHLNFHEKNYLKHNILFDIDCLFEFINCAI